jgi:head-tail adaptor
MSASVHLNRKLVLEAPVRVQDGAGGLSESWVAQGTLWAEVRSGTGRETQGQFLTVSTVPYKIIVRAAPDGAPSRPKPDQRFRDGNRLFRILAVSEFNGGGNYLICHAKEEVAA